MENKDIKEGGLKSVKTILKKILVILPAVILEALIIGLLVTIFRPWRSFEISLSGSCCLVRDFLQAGRDI